MPQGSAWACSLPLQTPLCRCPLFSVLLSLWPSLHPSKMPAPPWVHVSAHAIPSVRNGLQLPLGLVTLAILGLSLNVTSSEKASLTLWISPCRPFVAPIGTVLFLLDTSQNHEVVICIIGCSVSVFPIRHLALWGKKPICYNNNSYHIHNPSYVLHTVLSTLHLLSPHGNSFKIDTIIFPVRNEATETQRSQVTCPGTTASKWWKQDLKLIWAGCFRIFAFSHFPFCLPCLFCFPSYSQNSA